MAPQVVEHARGPRDWLDVTVLTLYPRFGFRAIDATDKRCKVHTVQEGETVALEDVEGYTVVPNFAKLHVSRTFGNGGLFGYYGTFSTAEYGAMSCQLRSLKDVFIIRTKRGTQPGAFSCI